MSEDTEKIVEPNSQIDLFSFIKTNVTTLEENGDFARLLVDATPNLPFALKGEAINCIVLAWIKKDQKAALDAIQRLSPRRDRQLALASWSANSDLSEVVALAASKDRLYPDEFGAADGGVYSNALRRRPDELAEFLSSQDIPPEYRRRISLALGSVSAKLGMSLSSSIAYLAGDDEQPNIVRGWMSEMAVSSPWVAKREIESNQDFAEFTPMIVEFCYKQDNATTRQWIDSMNDPTVKASAVAALVRMWVDDNSNEASKWVAALPAGEVRDKGALELVAHLMQVGDKAAALEWANSISEPKARESADAFIRLDP